MRTRLGSQRIDSTLCRPQRAFRARPVVLRFVPVEDENARWFSEYRDFLHYTAFALNDYIAHSFWGIHTPKTTRCKPD